jgi:sugar phosphate isomerase/epimerase
MKPNCVEKFKALIDGTRLLNVRYITTDTGDVKNKDDEKEFYQDMEEIGEYAMSKGILICFEVHGDWGCSGKKLLEIVKKIDKNGVRINYDTANAVFYGGVRPEEDLQYALPYMSFLHIKDTGGKKGVWDFPVLGEGTVDFNKIFNLIKDYEGPISLELEFDGKPHPLEYVNEGVKKCNLFLRSHGYGN